ncbi:MAG TPA: histidine kinase [Candidatus Sulfotelmatobacter sp.]|nr:histidine kinase [Candidatus Sulfotelmatobacter sp.]
MAGDDASADLQPRLAAELTAEAGRLGKELDEIELLIGQARTEAARHDARRATAEQRLTELQQARREVSNDELSQALSGLVTATRRAALMEGQIEVLEGKQKTVGRMRDRIADLAAQLGAMPPGTLVAGGAAERASADDDRAAGGTTDQTASSLLDAQEEMRRGIARAMHDGPAQSLTNITLQAQIVQRLMGTDPARAAQEVDQLVAMVEQTLEATKSFIFDVRPMVLDDLGLVPTLRRAARDRGRRSKVVIDFDSVGADRRLPDDVESALFRCADEAITGYLEAGTPHLTMRMDWSDHDVTTRVTATPPATVGPGPAATSPAPARPAPELEPPSADMPPALAAMIAERAERTRASVAEAAAAAAAKPLPQLLPARNWQVIQSRASAAGIRVALTDDGASLTIVAKLPA